MTNTDSVEGFYQKCAELLGTTTEYSAFPYRKRTRWNNRKPGNGRLKNHGLVRVYGEFVHFALRNPTIIKTFNETVEMGHKSESIDPKEVTYFLRINPPEGHAMCERCGKSLPHFHDGLAKVRDRV